MAWRPAEDPTGAENDILREFVTARGSLPFGNIAGPHAAAYFWAMPTYCHLVAGRSAEVAAGMGRAVIG